MATTKKNRKADAGRKAAELKRQELIALATGLGVADADTLSAKALKSAINAAQATVTPEALEAPAPLPEPTQDAAPAAQDAAGTAKPKKLPRVPLTSAQVSDRISRGLATFGQLQGGPKVGEPWQSPAGKGHVVIGNWISGDVEYVRTVRVSDGREFTAKHRRIYRDIRNQTGSALQPVAPAPQS